jgi:hypothetical protein
MAYPPANSWPPFTLWHVEQYPTEANVAPRATVSALKLEGSGVAISGIAGRHAKAANPSRPTTPAAATPSGHRRSFVRVIHRENNEAAFDKFVSLHRQIVRASGLRRRNRG